MRTLFLFLDLFVTTTLHLKNSLVGLCLLRFLCILVVQVSADLGITSNQLISDVSFASSGYSTAVKMFVDVDATLGKVEFSAADLLLSFLVRVQGELLGHLQDDGFSFMLVANMMIVVEGKILLLLVGNARVEGDTAVKKLILPTLLGFKELHSFPG